VGRFHAYAEFVDPASGASLSPLLSLCVALVWRSRRARRYRNLWLRDTGQSFTHPAPAPRDRAV